MDKIENQVETQNIYWGAFCLYIGLRLAGKRNDGRKVTLIFEGKDAQKKALAFFNGGKVNANAQELFSQYRNIKDTIFER